MPVKKAHSRSSILLQSGAGYQFACQPLFYVRGMPTPAGATRCAWPKRIKILRPQTSPIQEQSQWVTTTGEVLRHDSIYKRSDWTEDSVLESLHSQFKTNEVGVARPDGTGFCDKIFSVAMGLKDAERVQCCTKMSQTYVESIRDLPAPRPVGRLVLFESHGATALLEPREKLVVLARSFPELMALALVASITTIEGRLAVQFQTDSSGMSQVERDPGMTTADMPIGSVLGMGFLHNFCCFADVCQHQKRF